jgi:hypothetical protein
MNMQDNEMDQLFRAKLDSYEIEPSAKVWANISDELGGPAKRKNIAPMLRIAASVVVMVSAGLFFLTKKQDNVDPTDGKKQAVLVKPANPVQPGGQTQQADPVQSVTAAQPVNAGAQVRPVINTPVKQELTEVNHKEITPGSNTTVDPGQSQTPIDQPPVLITKVPDTQYAMPVGPISKPLDAINAGENSNARVLGSEGNLVDEEPIPAKKRKATGLGGFLNKVIAAVDKRDDKIIEFTDTDEGEAITGINLGIIKVKKQK